MDDAIAVLRDKILKERKNMGGVNAARDNQQMIQKQIRILENRLDKALVKFNQSLASNRTLREQIDDLRRERVVFDNIYKKLEKELHEKKKQMAHVIQLTNMTYEQRDNCQMEITAIDQANRKEQEDFEEQVRRAPYMYAYTGWALIKIYTQYVASVVPSCPDKGQLAAMMRYNITSKGMSSSRLPSLFPPPYSH